MIASDPSWGRNFEAMTVFTFCDMFLSQTMNTYDSTCQEESIVYDDFCSARRRF